jgi:hypothetical protein
VHGRAPQQLHRGKIDHDLGLAMKQVQQHRDGRRSGGDQE